LGNEILAAAGLASGGALRKTLLTKRGIITLSNVTIDRLLTEAVWKAVFAYEWRGKSQD
jgi:hypothetical protein